MTQNTTIRAALPSDTAALSRICLLTGDAGVSAEANHNYPELLGLVYALPYNEKTLRGTWTFVLVAETDGKEEVIGYVVGSTDTPGFEEDTEKSWWPSLRQKYPLEVQAGADTKPRTKADQNIISIFHSPHKAYEACLKYSPAHLHINILPGYQRQGWGRKLIGTAVTHMRAQIVNAGDGSKLNSVWLGMDPRNKKAAAFYARVGFKHVLDAPEDNVGLLFEEWESSR